MVVSEKAKTIGVLVCAVIALWIIWYTHDFRTYAKIHFLDVGQADATLIHVPTGEQMLIDCGKDSQGLEALQRTQNYFDRVIEYLVITHSDLDHFGGCHTILEHYHVEHILYNGLDKPGDVRWAGLWTAIVEEGAEVIALDDMFELVLGDVRVQSLFPDHDLRTSTEFSGNNSSVVLRVDSPKGSYLLTGDAEAEQEHYLIERTPEMLDVDVLKAGHHGSKTSSIEEFVVATSPDLAVVSAGADNRYGHPHGRVVSRFVRHEVGVLQTAIEGDIEFVLY